MPQWCDNCAKNVRIDNQDGKTCCSLCGKVLAEDLYTEEAQFVKTSNGQARMAGNFVRSVQANSESRDRLMNEVSNGLYDMMNALGIDGGNEIANGALRLYELALDKNFTRGRRREQVQAACLYIVCRVKNKPYLLIDFSEHLRINVSGYDTRVFLDAEKYLLILSELSKEVKCLIRVPCDAIKGDHLLPFLYDPDNLRKVVCYVLGAVFLQLCKIFSLDENPLIQKLVDPSLFIHRFADRLFKGSNQDVSKTALHIVASMKRDWMQTGRKPSGLCGAALYISALAHGLNCSKSEIIKAVHICEATLTKRLIEFENTESGCLTIEEFEKKSEEFAKKPKELGPLGYESKMKSKSGELLCIHKDAGIPQFAYGLCKDCYNEFMVLSGGLNGGSEPPAFQRAERKRIMAEEAAAADSSENLDSSKLPGPANSKLLNSNEQMSIKNTIKNDVTQPAYPDSTGAKMQSNKMDASDFTLEESESLSDIDDIEVDVYINTEEEKNLKTTVWEELNREYLEEQAAKQAAALAAKKFQEDAFANCSDEVERARLLAAAAAAAVANNRKAKRQKRADEFKNLESPDSTAGAVKQMLDKKKLSSRIRFDVVNELIDADEQSPNKISAVTEAETETEMEDPDLDGTEDAYTNYEEEYSTIY